MEDDKQLYLDQAVDWMIALQDAPNDQSVRSEFDEWLECRPEHKKAWQEISSTKNVFRSLLESDGDEIKRLKGDHFNVQSSFPVSNNTASDESILKSGASFYKFTKIAGVLSLLLCFFYFSPLMVLYLKSDYMTGVGQIQVIAMEDGSKVHLDSQSAIKVNFQENIRIIHLIKGRAFFDVVRNEERPFQVKSKRAEVTVLGTKFEIDTSLQHGAVSVVEGAVSVQLQEKGKAQKIPLTKLIKGDAFTLNKKRKIKNLKAKKIASWRKRKLIVDGWYATEVINELGRYYSGSIIFETKLSPSNRLSGIYDLKSPKEAIKLVAATEGLKVREITPWILWVSKN